MKKILLISFAVLLVVSSGMLWATETRKASLQGASDYTIDDNDVYTWPSLSPFFYRSMIADLGLDGDRVAANSSVLMLYSDQEQDLGIIGLGLNRRSAGNHSLGMYLQPVVFMSDTATIYANFIDLLQDRNFGRHLERIPTLSPAVSLLYAMKFGAVTLGGMVEYASGRTKNSYQGDNREAGASVTGITVSAGYQPKDGIRADVAAELGLIGFSSTYRSDDLNLSEKFESKESRRIAASGRAFYDIAEDMALVPVLRYHNTKLAFHYSQNDTGRLVDGSWQINEVIAGLGWQYQASPKVTVTAGVDFMYMQTVINDSTVYGRPGDIKRTMVDRRFPGFSIGLEASATKWLQLRMGAGKSFSLDRQTSSFSDNTTGTYESSSAQYRLSLGVGIKAGGLGLDFALRPEFAYMTKQFTRENNVWPVSQASLTYRF